MISKKIVYSVTCDATHSREINHEINRELLVSPIKPGFDTFACQNRDEKVVTREQLFGIKEETVELVCQDQWETAGWSIGEKNICPQCRGVTVSVIDGIVVQV